MAGALLRDDVCEEDETLLCYWPTEADAQGRLKTRDWKTRDHRTGVENARPLAMGHRSEKCSETERDIIVHC